MKIGVLYFCSGPYYVFYEDFIRSARKNFCRDAEVHFYIFTDADTIAETADTTVIYQQNLGWPFISLYRYRIFLRISSLILSHDYVVFFNANTKFVESVTPKDFFPEGTQFLAAVHPDYYDAQPASLPCEARAESTAYVEKPFVYVQGALMGGSSSQFLSVCRQLNENIEIDLQNGLLATVYDESHWNAFINNNHPHAPQTLNLLSPAYIYPEGRSLPFNKIIVMRDKSLVLNIPSIKGGLSFIQNPTAKSKFPLLLKRLKRALKRSLNKQ